MLRHLGSGIAGLLDHLGNSRDFQRPFLILLAIYSAFYFSELANFSLSIDDESGAVRKDSVVWLTQGRWLIYIVERFIVSRPVLPFFPGFVFGGLICAGYMLLIGAHRYRLDQPPAFLVFCLFGAFPTLYFILDFAVITVGLGVGILLSCVCLYLADRTLRAYLSGQLSGGACLGFFLLQVALGAAAIGAYQSLILLIAVGGCGLFIAQNVRGQAISLRQLVTVHAFWVCVLLASVLLSLLVWRGFQAAFGVGTHYIDHFWRPDQLVENPLGVIKNIVNQYTAIYGGSKAVYGFSRHFTFPAIILLGALALTLRCSAAGPLRMLLVGVYLAGMTAIPFALNIVSYGELPYRALIAVPYVFWFFAAGALFSHLQAVRRLAAILVVIMIVQCLYTFSLFQATKRLVLEHDMQLASQIYDRIAIETPAFDRSETYFVDFYGAHEFETVYPEIPGSTLSGSFFEWDGGNPGRMTTFMRIIGFSNIEVLDDEKRKAYLPVVRHMPIWPQRGSVKVIGNVVLVRLGEKPGIRHRSMIETQ